MKPALALATLLAATAAVATLARTRPPGPRRPFPATSAASARAGTLQPPCPAGFLPDEGVCVPAPLPAVPRAREPEGIPRLPERDAAYSAYVLPVPPASAEVDPTAAASDAGATRSGVVFRVAAGTPVVALELEGQLGAARLLSVGGGTVATVHRVGPAERARAYLVVIEPVASTPSRAPRSELASGAPLGTTTGTPLHVDVRRLRTDVDPFALAPEAVFSDSAAIPEDPRNVLRKRR